MKRVAVSIMYDGTRYHGFQRQRELSTVESAILPVLRSCSPPEGLDYSYSSRTDRDVSSFWQTLTFLVRDDCDVEDLLARLQRPEEGIGVWGFREVDLEFHARYWALWRDYVFVDRTENYKCDRFEELNAILKNVLSIRVHDFLYKDYKRRLGSLSLERRILRVQVFPVGEHIILWVRGESFPTHYVRRLADFLRKYECGRGFKTHIGSWKPGAAEGWRLFLTGVRYPVSMKRLLSPVELVKRVFKQTKIGSFELQLLSSFLSSSKRVLSPFGVLSW
uniref:tRNA pseudouridine(38-40) synthase TruA n=1 Tax=Fervidicoccus fontis TaxID=683846 RepID=A0A7J3ZNQ0_9CREN